ncbi:MAG TPA: RsmB/NOP family class I SAM-dependent RNA methyltransferase [Methanotrichaceae archaeon]|nr:RsmB/NOP family class I SAM-dependent RNA methyltransferase [Methanotrichaceae archaeon]
MDYLERYREIIPDFEDFLAILSQPLPASVRINTLKISKDRFIERLDRTGIGYHVLKWYPLGLRLDMDRPGKLIDHTLGYIHIQEEVSMVPPLVLDPKPGESVLDLCAAPGSKTTQIAQQMENRGLVVANEPSLGRLTPLRSNCERLGAINVAITRYDGCRFPDSQFDRVLADVPCSSEGTARKDLKVLNRSSQKRSLDLQRLQVSLLKRAVALTKPGGMIIYSTCTYAPEENESVVESVLDLGQVHLERLSLPGLIDCPGLDEWCGHKYSDKLKLCSRYYPHENDTGGFFVAKLIKS